MGEYIGEDIVPRGLNQLEPIVGREPAAVCVYLDAAPDPRRLTRQRPRSCVKARADVLDNTRQIDQTMLVPI